MEIISCLLFLLTQLISQSQSHPTLSITITPVGTCWLTPTFNSSTSLSLTSSTYLYKIYCLPTSNVTIEASNSNDSASAILINGEAINTLSTSLPTPNEQKWIEVKYLIHKDLFHTYRFQLFLSLPSSSHPSFPLPESSTTTHTTTTNNENSWRQKMSQFFSNKNNKKLVQNREPSIISSSTSHSLQEVQPMTFASDLLTTANVQNEKLFDTTSQECHDSLCPNQVCLERPSADNGTATYECVPVPTDYYGILSTIELTTNTAPFAFLGKEPQLIFNLARLVHIDSTRIAVNAIPYLNQTRVIIGVLPVSPYNLSIQATSREVTKILVEQLNNGTLNGSSELGTLTSTVVFGDEALVLNCSFNWQYQCEKQQSSFKDWMQAVLVMVVVVNVFICTYACCCRNSTLFFVYDKPSRSRTQRELEFGASEKDVNRTPPDQEHHTLSAGRGTFDQKRQSSPSATPRLVPMLSPGPASPSGVRIPASPSITNKSTQKEEDFNIPPRSSEEASFSRALSMGSRPGHKTTVSTSPTSKGQSPFKMEKQTTSTSLVPTTPSHLNDINQVTPNGNGDHSEREDSGTPEPSPKSSAQHERENLYVV